MGQKSGPVKGMPQPLPFNDKGHLLPDFYSGATGLSGR
jgi:hypothetical protein